MTTDRHGKHESRHVSIHVDRAARDVYAFAADPATMPQWAAGLGTGIVHEGDSWFVETPEGRSQVTFTPPNEFGVLDHTVLTPSGETVQVPLRVVADGDGAEVVLTVRRSAWMSDAEFDRDAAAVAADLLRLRDVLEG